MFDFLTFGKIIKTTNFTDSYFDMIVIYFEHKIITLYACAEANGCDTSSTFEIPNKDLSYLVGKTMLCIKESATVYDKSYTSGCKQDTPLTLIFNDNTAFDFKLINHSNGYYSGWLEVKEGEPPELQNNNPHYIY